MSTRSSFCEVDVQEELKEEHGSFIAADRTVEMLMSKLKLHFRHNRQQRQKHVIGIADKVAFWFMRVLKTMKMADRIHEFLLRL